MTLLECYKECFKIWDELAKNGNDEKPDTHFTGDCPCCEYVGRLRDNNCDQCPLIELWDKDFVLDIDTKSNEPCHENPESPFTKWEMARRTIFDSIEDRKDNAKIIADFCQKKIKEMTK